MLASAIQQHESGSHKYTSPLLEPLPHPTLGCHTVPLWAPWIIQQLFPLALPVLYIVVCMTIPIFQFIPPPPLIPGNHSLYSTSVTLFLLTNILKPVVRFNEKVLKANEQKMYLVVVWNRNQNRDPMPTLTSRSWIPSCQSWSSLDLGRWRWVPGKGQETRQWGVTWGIETEVDFQQID